MENRKHIQEIIAKRQARDDFEKNSILNWINQELEDLCGVYAVERAINQGFTNERIRLQTNIRDVPKVFTFENSKVEITPAETLHEYKLVIEQTLLPKLLLKLYAIEVEPDFFDGEFYIGRNGRNLVISIGLPIRLFLDINGRNN